MPSFQNILSSNEKRLDITKYCQDILDEGETEVFITIKKMPKDLKRKMNLLAVEKMDMKTNKKLLEGLTNSGLTLDQVKNLNELNPEDQKKALNAFIDADMSLEEKQKISDYEGEVEKAIFSICIDKEKHNFINVTDKGNEKIDISQYSFWNNLGKENLVIFIMDEIKKFSEDFFLTKNGEMK